jgi:transposase-like protein
MTRQGRYPQELRERAVRMVFEHQAAQASGPNFGSNGAW